MKINVITTRTMNIHAKWKYQEQNTPASARHCIMNDHGMGFMIPQVQQKKINLVIIFLSYEREKQYRKHDK